MTTDAAAIARAVVDDLAGLTMTYSDPSRQRQYEYEVAEARVAKAMRDAADAHRSAIAERDEARAERDKAVGSRLVWHKYCVRVLRKHREDTRAATARAEAAEARLEELTRERDEAKAAKDDAIADHRLFALHRKKQGDHDTKIIEWLQARLEEAKAVLERPLIYEIEDGGGEIHLKLYGVEIGVFAFDSPEAIALLKFNAQVHAFLHQGGSDAR